MTMVVRVTGGERATIMDPVMIFTNHSRSYLIQNVSDNIPHVCYRNGPKGWMNGNLFSQFFAKDRAY